MTSPNEITVLPVGIKDKRLHRHFIRFAHDLYAQNSCWVPFFNVDMRAFLTRRHPYYQNYPAQFFLAQRNNKVVGTISVSYNHNYNRSHDTNAAHFFFYDSIDDLAVSKALFAHAEKWAKDQGATALLGPMLSGQSVGSGLLIEGFEYPAMMTMMRYNFPYYRTHLEALGFKKYADLNSYRGFTKVKIDPRIARITNIVKERGNFECNPPKSKRKIIKLMSEKFEPVLNTLLGHYPENYPVPKNEQRQMIKDMALILRIDLLRYISANGEPVGFGFVFPDITPTLQKCKGRINPINILRLMYSIRHTTRYVCNGIGILPQYQKKGGTAVLYTELYNFLTYKTDTSYMEYTQIGETSTAIVSELTSLIQKKHKVHRMLIKEM